MNHKKPLEEKKAHYKAYHYNYHITHGEKIREQKKKNYLKNRGAILVRNKRNRENKKLQPLPYFSEIPILHFNKGNYD